MIIEELIAVIAGAASGSLLLSKIFKKIFNVRNVSISCESDDEKCICGIKIKRYRKKYNNNEEKEKEKEKEKDELKKNNINI